MESNDDRCWICLGGDGDWPPLASPGDSKKLIQICSCSLRVHKTCLLNYVKERELEIGKERNPFNLPCMSYFQGKRKPGGVEVLSVRPRPGTMLLADEEILCPQCGSPVTLVAKTPSQLLSKSNLVRSYARDIFSKAVYGGLVCGAAFSSSTAVLTMSTCAGVALWSAIAPTPTLMKILEIPFKHVGNTIVSTATELTSSQLSVFATFPAYLYTFISETNPVLDTFHILCLTALGVPHLNAAGYLSPKYYPQLFSGAYFIYKWIYKFTLNKAYYKMVRKTVPHFFLSLLEEFHQGEEEFVEEETRICEIKQRIFDVMSELPWYKRIWCYVFPPYTAAERRIVNAHTKRVNNYCLCVDFTNAFHERIPMFRILNVVLWPLSGAVVGACLAKVVPMNALSHVIETPEDIVYALNIVGMGIVGIANDLWGVYNAKLKYHMTFDMDILDTTLEGASTEQVAFYETSPGCSLRTVVANYMARAHGDTVSNDPFEPVLDTLDDVPRYRARSVSATSRHDSDSHSTGSGDQLDRGSDNTLDNSPGNLRVRLGDLIDDLTRNVDIETLHSILNLPPYDLGSLDL